MPLIFVRNDITRIHCDAIVNAANNTLLGGGGVDGAIHRAAGPGLLEECRTLGGCATGDAKLTGAYDLPCRYVVHTVGPVWRGGDRGEREMLVSCYRRSLEVARGAGCETVAFPLISSGAYRYPKREAFQTAVDAITGFLADNDMTVYLVIYFEPVPADEQAIRELRGLIGEAEVEAGARPEPFIGAAAPAFTQKRRAQHYSCQSKETAAESVADNALIDAVNALDESFSEMLLRKIDEKGMTDAECYKKANVDRKLFSKIRGDRHYRPSKTTALAFAIALELPLPEVKEMLMKAGFALSRSSKFDVIIEYFINNGNYNVFEINEALFAFDQALLGV